ncbi:hypothetical protein B0H14DRAFT_2598488 [Mycena olivaceomarginata]|nr:hypothetical protein B0H14DRAFT_2621795 [Mycena olivaceomarginata]KAJ7822565.1 hypothetical protein B0H14DRAFT_2598488 [Mycena olivaceomarginata]
MFGLCLGRLSVDGINLFLSSPTLPTTCASMPTRQFTNMSSALERTKNIPVESGYPAAPQTLAILLQIPPDPTPMLSYEYPLSSMDAPPMAERFVSVFGHEFPHGTWYQQQRMWKYSLQAERDNAAQLPCTSDGLWSTWRNTSSGWERACMEKRR